MVRTACVCSAAIVLYLFVLETNTHPIYPSNINFAGSAVWKASLPALFSTLVLLLYLYRDGGDMNIRENEENRLVNRTYFVPEFLYSVEYCSRPAGISYNHTFFSIAEPYAIGAYIAFFSFLLTFRLNFAYQRVRNILVYTSSMHLVVRLLFYWAS